MEESKAPKPSSIKAVAISEEPENIPQRLQSFTKPKAGSRDSQDLQGGLAAQVLDWLQEERARRAYRKAKHRGAEGSNETQKGRRSSLSDSSDGSATLDKLEQILSLNAASMSSRNQSTRTTPRSTPALVAADKSPGKSRHRPSSFRKLRRGSTAASSDTDYQDGDAVVPSCEAILDNSKTLSYTGGAGGSDTESSGRAELSRRARKEKEAWDTFKNEIVRLTHTLKLKGWRAVPLERGREIEVERISGALTNAVYKVSPPKNLPPATKVTDSSVSLVPSKPPPKLLLRIYGPQVEHLIDRDTELQVLQRLARKRIGPRLLGTFTNGRFEEFFYATTLTSRDLRIPDTSKHIAKRMRELHDGIELLEEERQAGPNVWRNWDKWVDRSEQVISWLDLKVKSHSEDPKKGKLDSWKDRGFICGVEWPVFRRAVERYRDWLNIQYGGLEEIKQQLVFAHNDTQYGNILRLQPSGESPLLLPANEHKQLVVIDFEYAAANLPGLEFANHFSEWCYNYHDPERSYALNQIHFPNPTEQKRFIKSYVEHRPTYQRRGSTSGAQTPGVQTPGLSIPISTFTLDSRAAPSQVVEEEARREEETEKEIERLMRDTRLWRPANSAQWVAWGIVQANVPEMTDDVSSTEHAPSKTSQEQAASVPDEAHLDVEEEDEFDYLAYAQERAMFFWGDLLSLGVIAANEIPPQLQPKLKIVNY